MIEGVRTAQCTWLREGLNEKKNVFLRALPESPNPPPDPKSGNLVLFFGRQNSRFESHLRTKSAKCGEGREIY